MQQQRHDAARAPPPGVHPPAFLFARLLLKTFVCIHCDGWRANCTMGNFCSSGRNPEAKKNKILGEAQRAVEERRLQEARKKQLLDKYFKAHLEAKQHDDAAELEPDESKKRDELQLARDCVQVMRDFKIETNFTPQKLAREEPVFQDEAWMEYLDVAGIQVSRLVEMSSEADAIYARCSHLSATPSDAIGRALVKTRETADAARRATVDIAEKASGAARRVTMDLAAGLAPGRS